MRTLREIYWWACFVYLEAAIHHIDPLSPDVPYILHRLAYLRDRLGLTGAYE